MEGEPIGEIWAPIRLGTGWRPQWELVSGGSDWGWPLDEDRVSLRLTVLQGCMEPHASRPFSEGLRESVYFWERRFP